MERLVLPNEHKLEFGKYFRYQKINTNFHPVYFIPCRKEENGEVIPSTRYALYFALDRISGFRKNQDFFNNPYAQKDYSLPQSYMSVLNMGYTFETLCDSTDNIEDKVKLESAVNFAAEEGYEDLVVGYYDTFTGEFIQGLYLKDFHMNETYNIIEYYMYMTWKDFYHNEDVFDGKVIENSHSIINELSFNLFRKDIVEMVHKLKLSCLEGSFNASYSSEYVEMNQEIVMVLSKYINNYEPTKDMGKLFELCSYLRSMDVVEFYANQNDNKYVSLSELLKANKNRHEYDNVVIAFHPRLKQMLSDKFG